MKKAALFGACVLLFASVMLTGCGSANSAKELAKQGANGSSQNLESNGKVLVQGGQPYKDLAKFESVANANPNNAQDQFQAAVSAYVNGKMDESVLYYKRAIKLEPNNGLYYNNLGNVYLRGLNQPKTALGYYEKAVNLDPSYDFAWLNLGICQNQLGQKSAAAATLRKGLSVLPKSDPEYGAIQKELQAVEE